MANSSTPEIGSGNTRGEALRFWIAAALILVLAGVFRLIWVRDIDYKDDQDWTYKSSHAVLTGIPWPWFGMKTSAGPPNPGGSLWVFVALMAVFRPDGPDGLTQIMQAANVVAVGVMIGFAWFCVPRSQRSVWLWGLGLAAVNTAVVDLHRKLWPPSAAPLLMAFLWIGYWYRDRRWGAALWGATVMAVAQIHLSGLFLAAALAGWALLFDRRHVKWGAWLLGSVVAGWPLAVWAKMAAGQLARVGETQMPSQFSPLNPFRLTFWKVWASEPAGFDLKVELGQDFPDFLGYPLIGGQSTYLSAGLYVILLAVALAVWLPASLRAWRERGQWRQWLRADNDPTLFLLSAVGIAYGALLTVTGMSVNAYYVSITFPLQCVWMARLALRDTHPWPFGLTRGQTLLAVSIAAQAGITALFLWYVHVNQRPIRGDYGTPYRAQVELGLPWR